jgi:2',3'-cyclic-nucleotide 2'-phosphodiesterase/3'-nucleotidase
VPAEPSSVPEKTGRRTVSRRRLLAGFGGSAAAILTAAGMSPEAAEAAPQPTAASLHNQTAQLTLLGTTDLHAHVFNWDYYNNREYDDAAHNDQGIAKVATLVAALRKQRGRRNVLLLDAGDTIQGTPLGTYYAKIKPISRTRIHPMATAMNALEYDASALGNHEFNYGIDFLRTFQKQLRFPLLGANALDWQTKQQVFPPYTVKTMWPSGSLFPVRVGILGLTNPGVAIWDKANVENKMHFDGVVEQAKIWVPRLRRISDVVVVLTHSGADTSSSYGDALPFPENASTLMAQQVPGIDAVLVGHAHVEIDDRFVTNEATGKQVLLTEPLCFGQRLSVIELNLKHSLLHGWQLTGADSHVLNSNTAPEDEHIKKLLTSDHQAVVDYVNAPVATCTAAMSCATARYKDAACIDFINYVQADAVKTALAGTPNLPVLSIAAPFNRSAAIPAGQVSVRDVAGLYIYDNTLVAVQLTGAQVKDYLEKSVEYFQQVSGAGPYPADQVTNAKTPAAPTGTPDYNYDIISGLNAPLAYDIDIAQPVGKRIVNLSYAGKPIDPAGQFVVAVNNYRQSGGGGFPHISTAPVLYNRQIDIRQLLIDWATAQKTIDPTKFATVDWKLVANGQPVQITG